MQLYSFLFALTVVAFVTVTFYSLAKIQYYYTDCYIYCDRNDLSRMTQNGCPSCCCLIFIIAYIRVMRAVNNRILLILFISSRKNAIFATSLFCKNAAHDGGCSFFDGQGRWVAARWPTYGRPRIEADSAAGLSPLRDLFIIGATLISLSLLASPPSDRHS